MELEPTGMTIPGRLTVIVVVGLLSMTLGEPTDLGLCIIKPCCVCSVGSVIKSGVIPPGGGKAMMP